VRFLLLSGSGSGGIRCSSATPRTHGPLTRGLVVSCGTLVFGAGLVQFQLQF